MTKWQKVQELAQTVWSVSQLSPSLSNFGEISQPRVFSTSENGDPSRGFFTGWLWKEMSFYVRNAERRLNTRVCVVGTPPKATPVCLGAAL